MDTNSKRMLVHLDTDLGGDIDDLCALAMLLRWPGVEIAGITTVSEENGRRAGYTRYALALAGREDISVAAGADVSLGCYREVPGYADDAEMWPEPVPPSPGPVEAALALLKRSIERGATVIAIGPYTNLALLDRQYPGLLKGVPLFLMGGYVFPPRAGCSLWGNEADYNIQLDISSVQHILERYEPTLIPLTVTIETSLRRAYLPALRRAGPLGERIARQAEVWARLWRNEEKVARECPHLPADTINFQHDPLACAVALGWDGVQIAEVPLRLEVRDGWLYERISEEGRPMKVVTEVDGDGFDLFWLQMVTGEHPF